MCLSPVPNPVLDLVASPSSTTSVKVEWSYPRGAQPYYKYLVQTSNATEPLTVTGNEAVVGDLQPGTRYDITVTTRAAEGSESTVEETFSYTSRLETMS